MNPDEEIVHFAFRPSNKDILSLVKKCPHVKALQIPSSYNRTISESIKMYLKMQDIEILEGDVWGHRKDINEYYEIPLNVGYRIKQYRLDGLQEEDIADKVQRETHFSPSFVSFLIKTY